MGTEVGGPFDGQPGCLINRAVLNDDILFPNNPNMPPWFPGGIGDMIFQNYVGLWASWSNDSFVTCNWEVDREDCLANSHFGFIKPLVGDGAEWEEWAERLDRLAGSLRCLAMCRIAPTTTPWT